MAKATISSIDPVIREYAEAYSVPDMFKIQEMKDKGFKIFSNLSPEEKEKMANVYMNFVAHKLIFQGGKDLEVDMAALIACGVNDVIPVYLPENAMKNFRNFCAAYVRTIVNLGLYEAK